MRFVILTASILIQMCLGGVYVWSAFVSPLRQGYGLSTAQTQLIFGVTIAVFTIAMVFAGRLQERVGPRTVACIGGVLFAGGYLIASFSGGSFLTLLTGVGLITGAGIGFAYVCPLASCVKWFPEQKGIVTGLTVAGFGAGAVILSFIAGSLFSRGLDVLQVFRVVGPLYGAVVVLCALVLRVPKMKAGVSLDKGFSLKYLLSQKSFWALAAGMFCGTFTGLAVVGNIKSIAIGSGFSTEGAGAAISAFAIGNACGRVSWGFISDKVGSVAIPSSLIVQCAAVAALPFMPSGLGFILTTAIAGFGFGACFVVYAAEVASEYGASAVGSVYPLIFLFYGFSGIVGPSTAGMIFDKSGSYRLACIVAAAIAGIGAVLSVAVRTKACSEQTSV